MGASSSETLEPQSLELDCPGSPNARTGSPDTSSGQVLATSGSSSDSDVLFDRENETEKEHPQDDRDIVVGGGFFNLGNTCFLNAVLQCFMHTVPVVEGLLAFNHPYPCDGYMEGFCMICALKELIENLLSSNYSAVSPWKLVNNINYFSSSFQRYQQEDAHEFLQCFLDRLESCCADAKQNELMPQNVNLVKQIFGGRLISKVRCCNCDHCSDTYEPLIDLSLEIEHVDSIPAALESFTKVEHIEDPEIKFTCANCKEQVMIEKQLLLDESPSVAAFHLKRFKNDGSVVEKIDKHVAFPLELDMLPYAAPKNEGSEGDSKYYLYAILVHIGYSSCSGHYYCFIRAAPDAWYKFDDSKVTRVDEDFVMSQEAYILFYAKHGTSWFSDFTKTPKFTIPKPISNTSPKSVLDNVDPISTIHPITCAVEVPSPTTFSRANHERVMVSEVNAGPHMMPTPVFRVATKSSEVGEMPSLSSPLEESSNRQNFDITKLHLNEIPKTPPRSPSPEIYREDSPDDVYSIPRKHLALVDPVSCQKRELQKSLETDKKRKQAAFLVRKNMPSARGNQLMAALRGTQSESAVDKKKRRMMASSPIKGSSSNSNTFHKSSFPPGSRPIIASGPR
ncbi:unnamed protein product [Cuscuta epithymum]|uniref:Ubiquitin carboxyl-terminal hydrolase n=1 Tax=Cuscuta epithymum TaxID=186058 RepID=A0AAV0CQA8_9ASTE|nr:unnamed protein product [Cuscuta epithymum]